MAIKTNGETVGSDGIVAVTAHHPCKADLQTNLFLRISQQNG